MALRDTDVDPGADRQSRRWRVFASILPDTDGGGPSGAGDGSERRTLPYEPGFDGLRGIGIVFMLLWHAQVSWLGDGPLFAIEMFFVLSGFLITSILAREHDRNTTIDLRRFWVRRARRLVPAVVGMVALVAVWTVLPAPWGPDAIEVSGLRGDGMASMLYASNWWFIFANRSYFQGFGSPSPFLHMWSLSVEEQFYVVVALVAFFGLRRRGSHGRGWVVFPAVGALVSAAWMATLARMGSLTADGLWPFGVNPAGLPSWVRTFLNMQGTGDQSRAYYGTDARVQSVLVGMATAFLVRRIDWDAVSRRTVEILGFVGFAGLVLLFAGLPRDVDGIFYGAFLACDLLTAMVIVALMAPRRPNVWHTLSWPPFVILGVLSYSLYVWHFPIFLILTEQRTHVGGWLLDVVRIGVSLVVAYCSYRFVEQPIRRHGLRTPALRRGALATAAATAVGFLVVSSAFVPEPADLDDIAAASSAGRTVVVVAGDSMAWTLALDVDVLRDERGRGPNVMPAAVPACPMTAGARVDGTTRIVEENPFCLEWPGRWRQTVQMARPPVSVVLAWGLEVQDHAVRQRDGSERVIAVPSAEWRALEAAAVQQIIDVLSSAGGRVVLLTLPCLDPEAADDQHKNGWTVAPGRVSAMNDIIRQVAFKNPSTTQVVDLAAYLCPDGVRYRKEIDGERITLDGVHFTREGAAKVWSWLMPQLVRYLPK